MRLGDFKYMFAARGSRRLRGSDIGLRVLAVALAIGLWIFVNAGERGSVATLTVPISYASLPQGMVIVNHPPTEVKIEVTGPRTLLSLLDPNRLTLHIDLRSVASGQSDFKIYPAMFNVGRNTAVTSISPDQLSLDVDRMVTRDVAPLSAVNTEPFDLKGLTSNTERSVNIDPPDPSLGLSTGHVDAKINVSEAITDREFRAVDVEVKDSDLKYRVEPKQATLTIRGPAVKLAGLAPKGLAYVDAKGVAPGSHELPLQVTVPDGMQLVRQSPDKVKLRTYHEKLTTTADEHPS